MTLRTRFVLSAFFAMGLTTAASAQQWGPSAQSHVYHDPANPQTLTAYNTETTPRQQAPAQIAPAARKVVPATAPRTAAKTATPVRRHTATVHPAAYYPQK